jgi:hypothetical protein
VKQPSKDDERLAALLDGRVDAREREELLKQLAAGGEDYAVFTQTASILRRLEESEPAEAPRKRQVLPFRRRAGAGTWATPARVAALAAVVAAVAVGGVWALRHRREDPGDPVRLAVLADSARNGLPKDWPEQNRWVPTRGGGIPPGATPAERNEQAARAGARLLDLTIAVRARDSDGTRLWVAQLAAPPFLPGSGPGSPLGRIQARAGAPADSLEPLVAAVRGQLEKRFEKEKDFLHLGAWAEAAGLAARAHNEAFFRSRESKEMLRRADRITAKDPVAHVASEQVRQAIAPSPIRDWEAVTAAVDSLLRTIAS